MRVSDVLSRSPGHRAGLFVFRSYFSGLLRIGGETLTKRPSASYAPPHGAWAPRLGTPGGGPESKGAGDACAREGRPEKARLITGGAGADHGGDGQTGSEARCANLGDGPNHAGTVPTGTPTKPWSRLTQVKSFLIDMVKMPQN